MLTITAPAAALLVQNREQAGVPDNYGVRLFATTPPGGGPSMAVAFVPDPEPGDQVTEQEGVKAYVAPEVSDALDAAVLDATPADGGEQLVLRR